MVYLVKLSRVVTTAYFIGLAQWRPTPLRPVVRGRVQQGQRLRELHLHSRRARLPQRLQRQGNLRPRHRHMHMHRGGRTPVPCDLLFGDHKPHDCQRRPLCRLPQSNVAQAIRSRIYPPKTQAPPALGLLLLPLRPSSSPAISSQPYHAPLRPPPPLSPQATSLPPDCSSSSLELPLGSPLTLPPRPFRLDTLAVHSVREHLKAAHLVLTASFTTSDSEQVRARSIRTVLAAD